MNKWILKTVMLLGVSCLISMENLIPGSAWFFENHAAHAGSSSLVSPFRLSGYATLSIPMDDRNDMAPVRDICQEHKSTGRPYYEKEFIWDLDSRLGIQADYRFSNKVEAVVQGLLSNKVNLDILSSIESAFIGITPTPAFKFRLGRISYDAFLMSDTRNIGYATLWVRPPVEFYGWIPIFHLDGGDVCWTIDTDKSIWKLTAQAGQNTADIPIGMDSYEFKTTDLWVISINRQSGPLQLKAGYSYCTSDNSEESLMSIQDGLDSIAGAVLNQFPDISSEAAALKKRIGIKDAEISYTTLGAYYDNGTWIIYTELSRCTSTTDNIFHGITGYIGAGHRFGDFTPYCMYSAAKSENDIRKPEADWSVIGQESFQKLILDNIINNGRFDQETFSLGIRWNFHPRAAIKLQWDHSRIDKWGYGLVMNDPELVTESSNINLGTLALEFIF